MTAPTTKRITVKDVASEAGVAIGTVSRVVRGEPNVTPEVSAKVNAAIAKLGWRPSRAAQSMRSMRSRTIGFIFSDIRNPLYPEMVKGAEEVLAKYGYMLIVGSSDGNPKVERALIERFSDWNIEGLLFTIENEEDAEVGKVLSHTPYPKIMIERDHAFANAAVGADHYRGTLQATEYLLSLGHTRIGLISGGKYTRVCRDRRRAYYDAHEKFNVPVDENLLRLESFSQDYGYRETQLLLSLDNPPSALLILGMRLLAGVLPAIRNKNLTLPTDIFLICSNDSELAQLATPAISTIRYDPYVLGREAAQLLMNNLVHNKPLDKVRLEIPTELVMRQSCAAIQPGN